jgi:ribonuclease BN (tRNA processing enzyme)
VELTVVGCSPAWPNPAGAHSGYLLEQSGRLLLDCGPGVLSRLREVDDWPEVDAVVLTHLHLDHWGDLVPWILGAAIGPGRGVERPQLWVPEQSKSELLRLGAMLSFGPLLEQVFALQTYDDEESFQAAGLTVTPFRVPHYDRLSFALRVADGRRTLTYSGDSGPSDRLVEAAHDADLFLCEATLAESREAGRRGHLSAEEALAAQHASGAGRLVIVHRPAELPTPDGVERARDGDRYTV